MKSVPKNFRFMRVLLLIGIVLGMAPLAALNAQGVDSQPAQKELIKNNLEPFAGAYKEVSQIHTAYKQQIIESTDETRVDALQREANQKMNQAVANHGLTVEDYNTIFKAIQTDPTLKEDFVTVLNRNR